MFGSVFSIVVYLLDDVQYDMPRSRAVVRPPQTECRWQSTICIVNERTSYNPSIDHRVVFDPGFVWKSGVLHM